MSVGICDDPPDSEVYALVNSPTAGELSQMSERELFGVLGASLLGDGLGAGAADSSTRSRYGKEWFTDRTTRFQEVFCGTRFARELRDDGAADVTEMAAIFLPVVNQNQVTAMVVAAIVVRRGTKRFCRSAQSGDGVTDGG